MKIPSISLKRTLDVTMNDIFLRIKELGEKDSKALREEFKEWIEANGGGNKQLHVLYLNQMKPNS